MQRLSTLGLAVLLSLAAPAAMANSTASASLSNLQLWVFDLTPLDGITPTFTIQGQLVDNASASAWLETGENDFQYGGLNLSASVSSALANAGASLVGGMNLSDFVMNSSASSSASAVTNSTDAYAYAGLGFNVQFSSDALLVITGLGSVSASMSSLGIPNTSASGHSYVQISSSLEQGSIYSQGSVQAYVYEWTQNSSSSLSGSISASLLNTSGADMSVWIGAYANSNVTAAPVPEPGSYALMGAGLLGMGAWLRRRRR